MKSNYDVLGKYIVPCDELNSAGELTLLQGISNEKYFQGCKSNTNDIDLTRYRICRKGWFCYNRATTRNGEKISIAYREEKDCLVSPSYKCFKIVDENKLDPIYLLLWFKRPEFDRYARFMSHGSAHEYFEYEQMCDVVLPVPSIEEQRKIVANYRSLEHRISLLSQINDNLEATAQAIYKETVLRADSEKQDSIYSILSVINGSPFSSEMFNSEKRGYPLVRIRDLSKCDPDIYTDEMINKMEYVNVGDILIGMDGEFIPHIWYGHKGVLNQRVCKVIPTRDTVHPLFLYLTLKPILAEVQRTQGGTTVIHIGKKDFDRMVCVSLTEEEHVAFSRKVLPLYNRMLENYQEMLLLSQMQTDILSLLSH